MIEYSEKNKITVENIEYINRFKLWLSRRYRFLSDGDILDGLKLLSDISLYHGVKRYVGDWYLLLMNK